MIIRLMFAVICSLLILGLIPYLNRTRTTSEKPIISYRLHPFETKVDLPVPSEEKPAIIEKIEQAVTIETALPKTSMIATSQPINKIVSSQLTFSASAFVGSYSKGSTSPIVTGGTMELKVQPLAFQADGGDHLLYGPKPITPLRARQQGINGNVMMHFEVNEKGLVENINVVKSSDVLFDMAVINAIKQYRFTPYTDQNGVLIRVSLAKEFTFEVK